MDKKRGGGAGSAILKGRGTKEGILNTKKLGRKAGEPVVATDS
jgi:hypothetical protein